MKVITNRHVLIAQACCLIAAPALAEDHTHAPYQSVYIAPSVGYTLFDSVHTYGPTNDDGYSIEDELNLGIGLGYQFNRHWAVEINYQQTDSERDEPRVDDVKIEHLHLDGMYHFNNISDNSGFYIPFGIGEQKYQVDDIDSEDETSVNVGVGYRYMPFSRVYFRTDVRAVYGDEADTVDGVFNLGVVFMFATPPSQKRHQKEEERMHQDADSDGVMNADDQCANTLSGTAVDAKGCDLVVDADEDGVLDTDDQCADTPMNTQVDNTGCAMPMADADGDGIDDSVDKCSNTTEGWEVDAMGCPVAKDRAFELEVGFKNASNQVTEASMESIDHLGEIMANADELSVRLLGYTDSSGPAAFNQDLSEKRAQSVKNLIVERHDVDASRIEVVGKGEADPIADNRTREGRAQNRRVVAELAY
jgi:OOP family OmpA-OmpF porin